MVARHVRELFKPRRIYFAKFLLAVHVRLVEDFKISIRVLAVLLDKRRPHFPPVVHVFRRSRLRRAPVGHQQATTLQRYVQNARIGGKVPKHRRLVHRDAHTVRAQHLLKLPDDAFRHHRSRLVVVRLAQPRKYQHIGDEVIAFVGPVDATELARDRKGTHRKRKNRSKNYSCFHTNILILPITKYPLQNKKGTPKKEFLWTRYQWLVNHDLEFYIA